MRLGVVRRERPGGDRRLEVLAQLVDARRPSAGSSNSVADRARVAAHERDRLRVLGEEREVGAEAVVDEALERRRARAARRARARAPRRRSRRRARGAPTPCRGSSCRTCPSPGRCGGRCRARAPRRSRSRANTLARRGEDRRAVGRLRALALAGGRSARHAGDLASRAAPRGAHRQRGSRPRAPARRRAGAPCSSACR